MCLQLLHYDFKNTSFLFRFKKYLRSSKSYYLKSWYNKALLAFLKKKYLYKFFIKKTNTNLYITVCTWEGRCLFHVSKNRFKSKLIKKNTRNIQKPFFSFLQKAIFKLFKHSALRKTYVYLYCNGPVHYDVKQCMGIFFRVLKRSHLNKVFGAKLRKNYRILKVVINPSNAHNGFRLKKKRRL